MSAVRPELPLPRSWRINGDHHDDVGVQNPDDQNAVPRCTRWKKRNWTRPDLDDLAEDHVPHVSVTFPFTCRGPVSPTKK